MNIDSIYVERLWHEVIEIECVYCYYLSRTVRSNSIHSSIALKTVINKGNFCLIFFVCEIAQLITATNGSAADRC